MSHSTPPGILIDVSKVCERFMVRVEDRGYECADMNTAVAVVNAILCGQPIPESAVMRRAANAGDAGHLES